MPLPSVSHTFTNGTTADGGQVSTNFTDVVGFCTDGTKDFTIRNLTLAGTFTANSTIVLGDNSSDSITWTGTAPSITLNNGATDGGSVYFDAGSTSYLQASADGLTLTAGGFTAVALPAADLTIGAGTSTATTPNLTVNSNTGDATIRLQVNNSSTNAWDIRNDNSASDHITFEYGGVEAAYLSTGGNIVAVASVEAPYFLPSGDDTSAPAANRLYKANVPKAWALMTTGAAGSVTITDDHNISSASWSSSVLTVNIDTNMANSTYAAMAQLSEPGSGIYVRLLRAYNMAAGSYDVNSRDTTDGLGQDYVSGDVVQTHVFGDQ